MKKILAFGVGLGLVASSALASNTGFKLNYPLFYADTGKSNNNWISFPYFYYPNGNVGQPSQTALDICKDLNDFVLTPPPKVGSIIRFDSAKDQPIAQSCTFPVSVFDYKPGEGYSVKPVTTGVTINIVGSHDDNYAPNKTNPPTLYPLFYAASGKSNNNWWSVPYHAIKDQARDICTELNALTNNGINSVIRFDSSKDQPIAQSCTFPINVFTVTPGEGVSIKPNSAGVAIGLEVY